MLNEWIEIMAPAVRAAGTDARRQYFGGDSMASRKAGGEWVTSVDHAVENYLIEKLQHYFPQHGILGEESGQNGSTENCWIIDPLDGTTNFVHRFPHFAVSLAYYRHHRPVLAIIYDIMHDHLYTAIDGGGAYREDERLRLAADKVQQDNLFKNSLFIASGQINDGGLWELVVELSRRTEGVRKTGSSVLDLAYLAAGQVDAVVSGPVNFWDVAAGSLLVREAGGFICDIHGSTEFAFGKRTDNFVAAAAGVFNRYLYETKKHCGTAAG